MTLIDDAEAFHVIVTDEAPSTDAVDGLDVPGLEDLARSADLDLDTVPPGVGLAATIG